MEDELGGLRREAETSQGFCKLSQEISTDRSGEKRGPFVEHLLLFKRLYIFHLFLNNAFELGALVLILQVRIPRLKVK